MERVPGKATRPLAIIAVSIYMLISRFFPSLRYLSRIENRREIEREIERDIARDRARDRERELFL